MADDTDKTDASKTDPATSGLTQAQSGGKSDAGAINPDPGNEAGSETPKEAAKDPTRDPAVAGEKLMAGQNTPANAVDPRKGGDAEIAAAIRTTPHKIKGFDVTQPPALDLDSGLSRTTLFEKTQDDKKPSAS